MLDQVKKKEGKEALKRANKQIHQEDSDDDSDSDADDSSSDDDDDDSAGATEEVKGGDEPTHDANGKVDGRNGKSGEEEMSDEEHPSNQDGLDSSDDEYENEFELAVITDMIKTPLIKQDEFSIFSQAINTMAT